MEDLEELKKLLLPIMDEDYIDEWIHKKNPALRGMTPIEVVETGRVDIIEDMVEEVKQCGFL